MLAFRSRLVVAITRTSTAISAFAADAFEFALLQDAQQLGLQRNRHFRNFIEQQRAAVGEFELAFAHLVRAGECAFLVAEQNRFEHVFGNRRAVDRDEWHRSRATSARE